MPSKPVDSNTSNDFRIYKRENKEALSLAYKEYKKETEQMGLTPQTKEKWEALQWLESIW
jgi:hypothetical protein